MNAQAAWIIKLSHFKHLSRDSDESGCSYAVELPRNMNKHAPRGLESVPSHSISSSFTETDFSRNLFNRNWLSYLTNLKTKYKKKKENKQAKKKDRYESYFTHISSFILFYRQLYIDSYPIRLLKYLAAFLQIWLTLKAKPLSTSCEVLKAGLQKKAI